VTFAICFLLYAERPLLDFFQVLLAATNWRWQKARHHSSSVLTCTTVFRKESNLY